MKKAFAPASVANLACGFDILGLAFEPLDDAAAGLGDVVTARWSDGHRGRRGGGGSGGNGGSGDRGPVTIAAIAGDDGRLPVAADRNTAGVATRALLRGEAPEAAVTLEIEKRMPLESGLGSSAASAVAAVVAVDALLGLGLPPERLLRYAVAGEVAADGGRHADNLAPSLLGGIVLVRSLEPAPDIVELPVPPGLTCALAHPHLGVNTRDARTALGRQVPLRRAVTQWGNCAALVAALYRGDLELLSRALVDVVAEPVRAAAVPGFAAARAAALDAGALGCSLSGSGPSMFALCDGVPRAREAAGAMAAALEYASGADCDRWVASLPVRGARVIGESRASADRDPAARRSADRA